MSSSDHRRHQLLLVSRYALMRRALLLSSDSEYDIIPPRSSDGRTRLTVEKRVVDGSPSTSRRVDMG